MQRLYGKRLAIVFFLLLLLCSFVNAKESDALQTSQECVDFIKEMEGFSEYPYWDHQQWTIGYGTACEEDAYPDGITQEDAENLLYLTLETIEASLNDFLYQNNIMLSQSQYDALVSFTFNVGYGWTDGCKLRTYLEEGIENYTVNEVASAFGIWCHAGDDLAIDYNLVARRIREVQIFLYGDYSGNHSANFVYIVYDGNGGMVDMDLQLFEQGQPYGSFTTAQWEKNTFLGWHTLPTGGTAITENSIALKSMTLYATWEEWQPPSFTDILESDWYYQYVMDLAEAEVISGYTDGTFRPENTVTVAEALKLVFLGVKLEPQAPTTSHWASGYLAFAEKNGFLDAGQVADLDAPITRQLICQLASRALELELRSSESPFTDTDNENILSLYQAGIINGYTDGTFRPEGNLKRSEVSAIIWRIYRYISPNADTV